MKEKDLIAAGRRFLSYLSAERAVSEHTLRAYQTDLTAFKTYLEEQEAKGALAKKTPPFSALVSSKEVVVSVPIEALDRKVVRSYLASLHQRGLVKKTLHRHLSTLRSFFRYLVAIKWMEHHPMEGMASPKLGRPIPTALAYEQIEHLFSLPSTDRALGCRDRCAMELFYSSGLRVSELVGLNLADLDLEQRAMRVKGKGKKERRIPITVCAVLWIKRYLPYREKSRAEGERALFLNRFGYRLSVRSVDRMFQKYLRQSGLVETVTPHSIRHTIATHWLENGMNLKLIQALLGHSSLKATTVYTQVSTRLKREVYEKAHPRARMKQTQCHSKQ